jgi:hypothetical protein
VSGLPRGAAGGRRRDARREHRRFDDRGTDRRSAAPSAGARRSQAHDGPFRVQVPSGAWIAVAQVRVGGDDAAHEHQPIRVLLRDDGAHELRVAAVLLGGGTRAHLDAAVGGLAGTALRQEGLEIVPVELAALRRAQRLFVAQLLVGASHLVFELGALIVDVDVHLEVRDEQAAAAEREQRGRES